MKRKLFITVLIWALCCTSRAQSYNTASSMALANLTSGDANTGIGYGALYWSDGIWNCSAHGSWALFVNLGDANSAFGGSSMYNNSYGYENSAMGFRSLFSNTNGIRNTAVGTEAMYSTDNTGGGTALGYYALHGNVTGNFNTAVGYSTGITVNASTNTLVGAFADANASYYTNSTGIGANTLVTGSNMVRFGDNNVTSIGGSVNWSVYSDKRIKRDVRESVPGLSFIRLLKPVTYRLDLNALDAIVQRPTRNIPAENIAAFEQEQAQSRKAKEAIVYTGFLAQDVESSAAAIGYDFSGIDAPKNEKDLYGLRYAEFVVPLVKATQELTNTQDSLQQQIEGLKQQVVAALQELATLKERASLDYSEQVSGMTIAGTVNNGSVKSQLDEKTGFLEQNTPNPFSRNTTIKFCLPSGAASGQIVVKKVNGQQAGSYSVNAKGRSQFVLPAGNLISGIYTYSLLVNGHIIDTKQMIIIK